MLAADAGKTIQKKYRLPSAYNDGEWRDCIHHKPGWNFYAYDYRVKPEPQTKIVYRLTFEDGSILDFDNPEIAINRLCHSVFYPTLQKITIEL